MSNPFQFPSVTPGQVINDPGIGGVLGSGIAGVVAAMQEREKLDRERQEFESKQAYFKTLDTGNQLDNETKKATLKKEARALEAKGAGLAKYQEWVGGGAKQEGLGSIIARINDPDTAQDFVDRVTKHRQQENDNAIAAKNATEAAKAAALLEDEIKGGKAQSAKQVSDAKVQTETEGAQIRDAAALSQLHQAQAQDAAAPAGVNPNVVNAATNMGRTFGLSIGDAFKGVGATLPAGIDPNAKGAAGGAGMGAADKRRGEIASISADAADRVINELEARGVKIHSFTPLIQGRKLGNMVISEDEQQLIQANRQFGQMYALFVTGQAASDPLLREINNTIVPAGGDRPGVKQQKAIMRQVVVQAMKRAYGNGLPASQALMEAVEVAKGMGVKTDAVKFLQKSALDAANAEVQAEKDAAKAPVYAPMTNAQPADYDSVMGAYNFGGK
jgi:hypothetical protein